MTTTQSEITEERLREMLAGLEGVTPGPWIHDQWGDGSGGDNWIVCAPALEAVLAPEVKFKDDAAHIARCDPDTMRQVLTLALDALTRRSSAGVVKGLVWDEDGWPRLASSLGLLYRIYGGRPAGNFRLVYPNKSEAFFDTIPEAKAAAQADYDRRILSALFPQEPVTGEAVAGWKLVPTQPTQEMVNAGLKAKGKCPAVYRAMLNAAPIHPAPSEGEASRFRQMIDELRREEGDQVTILCDNPDFNGQPNNAVVISAGWTNWQDFRVGGHTLDSALENAVAIKAMAPADRPPMPAALASPSTGVNDAMVGRFAQEMWKLDDAYARSIPHSKIRAALLAALAAHGEK